MAQVYQRLIEAYEQEETPRAAARAALAALRHPSTEVLAAGITAVHWRTAIEGLLKAADAADAAQAQREAEERKRQWLKVRTELGRLGCEFWRFQGADDRWAVEGPGVNIEIDMVSGEISGLDADFHERADWTFEELLREIGWRVRTKRAEEAAEARRRDLRETHTWVNGKGWVPNDGNGPIIPGGGSRPN